MSSPFPNTTVALTGQYVAAEAFTPLLNKGKLIVQFGDGTQPFPLVAGPTGPASTVPGPPGRGISSVSPTGLITYSDGATSQLTLPLVGGGGTPATVDGGTL